jgi:oleate hydratase
VDGKTAWFVGSGLAALSGAAFLIRDGHMAGERITILERLALPGGALDGIEEPEKGFVIRGGREMEAQGRQRPFAAALPPRATARPVAAL